MSLFFSTMCYSLIADGVFPVRLKRIWVFDTVFKSTALKKKKHRWKNKKINKNNHDVFAKFGMVFF